MRTKVKEYLTEMVEYIGFPTVIYVYETGKIIACNHMANDIFGGGSCQNINLLWTDGKKLKLPTEVLDGESRMYYGKEIIVEEEVRYIDMEVTVIHVQNVRLVISFIEQSYKQAFRMDQSLLLPQLLWYNAEKKVETVNLILKRQFEHWNVVVEHVEQADEKERDKALAIIKKQEELFEKQEPEYGVVEQVELDDKQIGYLNASKVPFFGKQDELLGFLVISMPVVSDKEYTKILQNAKFESNVLRECLIKNRRIIISVEKEGRMILKFASDNISSIGYTMEDIAMQELYWLDIIHEDDRERVLEELKDAYEHKDCFVRQKYRILDKNQNEIWVDTVCMGYDYMEDGKHLYMVVSKSEDDFKAEYDKQIVMKRETYVDFLTGLPNRLKFEIDAKKMIETAIESKKKGCIIVLDLDDFKHINEGLGPEYGDILLKKIASAINDIPEVENYCYRIDGDEFLIFVRSEYYKQTEEIIQKCLIMFQKSWQLEDKECYCTVSVGISDFPRDAAIPRELLKKADAAVYEAKRKGKNRIQHYKKAVLKHSQDRVNYEKYLRKAIERGCVEFEMHFQPIVATQSKELVSAEALVRWYSPELGFITPVNFISLSEYLGLIVPLGEYVLRESFLKCKEWNEKYDPNFMVSVNLSVVQLVQMNIVERIMEIARSTGVNTNNIILEVTESLAVEDMNLMKNVLNQLRECGFKVALDDFGTGYSSLNHIMEMPLNYVKIDRSFVSTYGTEAFNPSLLSAICDLAHSVGMGVVVEGVETKQQMEFLMFLNTDRIQGYLYGKPVKAEEFEETFF
ncbi:MAG: GGDEF and EAL domain-containing protein [Lachnospiraceae bacterium]|nr:GGDEF and EAL domain-containing protein [Lachnospiraceae bacterium]